MQQITQQPATASGTFTIGGDLTVYHLGFGAMRLTGPGIWGPPADKQEAIAVLHRALELGVNLLDTADSYRPGEIASCFDNGRCVPRDRGHICRERIVQRP